MFSVDWVDDCIKDQKLIELDTFTYRLKNAAKNTRRPFSREDDKLLEEFVKSKRAVNAPINGNKIYEDFAAQVKTFITYLDKDRMSMCLVLSANIIFHHSNDIY